MTAILLEEFRRQLLAPTQWRCRTLAEQLTDVEGDYRRELERGLDYNDGATATAQRRVEELRRELARWEERLTYLAGRENGRDALGQVWV